MNEKALQYSFNLFTSDGYNGTFDDYKKLIASNKDAINYSYKLFSEDGYTGSLDEFSFLLGVGKQQTPAMETASAGVINEAGVGESTSVNGSLDSSNSDLKRKKELLLNPLYKRKKDTDGNVLRDEQGIALYDADTQLGKLLFSQDEAEGGEELRQIYQGTNLIFEEVNQGQFSDENLASLRKANPQAGSGFEFIKVKVPGASDHVVLEFNTDFAGLGSKKDKEALNVANLNLLKNYIEKNIDKITVSDNIEQNRKEKSEAIVKELDQALVNNEEYNSKVSNTKDKYDPKNLFTSEGFANNQFDGMVVNEVATSPLPSVGSAITTQKVFKEGRLKTQYEEELKNLLKLPEDQLAKKIAEAQKIVGPDNKVDINKLAKMNVLEIDKRSELAQLKTEYNSLYIGERESRQAEFYSGLTFANLQIQKQADFTIETINTVIEDSENKISVLDAAQNYATDGYLGQKQYEILENYVLTNTDVTIEELNANIATQEKIDKNGTSNVFYRNKFIEENLKNIYDDAYSGFEINKKVFQDQQKKLEDLADKNNDVSLAMQAASYNYNEAEKYIANIGLGGLEIVGGGLNIVRNTILTAGEILDLSEDAKPIGTAIKSESAITEFFESAKDQRAGYVADVKFSGGESGAFGSITNFGKFVAQEVSNQLPIFATVALSGGYAGLVLGITTAGQKQAEMTNLIASGEKDYSAGNIWLTSLGHGIAEGGFAQISTVPILKRAKTRWMNAAGKNADEVFNNSTRAWFKENSKATLTDIMLEPASEIATQFTQNYIDGVDPFEGIGHAGFSALGFSLALSGVPFVRGTLNSRFSSYEGLNKSRALDSEITDLANRYNALDKRTKEAKDLKNTIEQKKSEYLDVVRQETEAFEKSVTEEGLQRLIELRKRQVNLQNQARNVLQSDISEAAKKVKIAELQQKFANLNIVLKRARSLETKRKFEVDFRALEGTNKTAYDNYQNEAASQVTSEKDGKTPTEEEIDRRAYDLYFADVVRQRNNETNTNSIKIESFETVNEAVAELDSKIAKIQSDIDSGKIDPEKGAKLILDIELGKRNIELGGDGFAVPSLDGRKTEPTIAVVENQVKNQRKAIKTHEIGHQVAWKVLTNNLAGLESITDQLLKSMQSLDNKTYKEFLNDTRIYKTKIVEKIDKKTGKKVKTEVLSITEMDNEGNILAGDLNNAEVLSVFMEYVADGKFTSKQKARGISGVFGAVTQKSLSSYHNFDFHGTDDAYNFVVAMAQKIKDGTLTRQDISNIKSSDLIKNARKNATPEQNRSITQNSAGLEADLNALEQQLSDNEIDYDTFEQKVAALEAALKIKPSIKPKAKPKRKEGKKDETLKESTARSKKILDRIGNDPNGYNPNNSKIVEVLSGIIESKSKVFRTADGNVRNLTNLPGFEMQNMVQETITGLVPMINKFDPEINDSLYGYLNSQIANKMRGALKSGKVTDQKFTEDVSTAKGVAADNTTTLREDPGYKKIKDSNTFGPEVISNIKNKVVSTVRVLKSKIKAAVGKNQNTSPLVAEFTESISKQADIDIKKAIGGKKDKKLRNWTIENKQAIVENATTTWLMGKDDGTKVLGGIPIAIEKKLKSTGQFVGYPEWIGQEIARETTEGRGATAGNQIVRRVPFDEISDTDFADFVTKPDGTPIRGRKESLSKELATELASEIFVDAIETGSGPVYDAFANNREAMKDVLLENTTGEIVKQFERGTVKFSSALTPDVIFSTLNAMTEATQTGRRKAIKGVKSQYPEAAADIDKYIVKPYANQMQIISKMVRDGEIKDQGFAYEIVFRKEMEDFARKNKDFQIKNIKLGQDGIDIQYKFKGQNQGIELKLSKDSRLSSFTVNSYAVLLNNASPSLTINTDFNEDIINALKKNQNVKNYLQKAIELGATVEAGTKEKPGGSLYINDAIYSALQNEFKDFYTDAATLIDAPWSFVSDIYTKNKAFPVNTINFRDIGAFYMGQNSLNVNNLPELATYDSNGNQENGIKVRMQFQTRAVKEQRKDGMNRRLILKGSNSIKNASFSNKLSQKSKHNLSVQGGMKQYFDSASPITAFSKGAIETNLALTQALNPVKDMKKFDPYGMADVIAARIFKKEFENLPSFRQTYNNLTESQKVKVREEMIKNGIAKMSKGISVWDFDDTLATTKSKVLYTMLDGSTGSLTAEQFAKEGDILADQGAAFDFSEFEKVMKGAKGPMFNKAVERNKKFGNDNVYILTARPAASSVAIHEFLKGIGLDIKLENIVGLGDGTAKAKADWVKGKVAEGYNDFYFADDAYKNVKAVQQVLEATDIKSKVQQAMVKFSAPMDPKVLSDALNQMIERRTGIGADIEISKARAQQLGQGIGRFDLFIPPNAEDFQGLLYKFLGKGKQGDADMKFFKDNLFDPFNEAENSISSFRQRLAENLQILNTELGNIEKDIDSETIKRIEKSGFTADQAVRVFVWNKKGETIPDLTSIEKSKLVGIVMSDAKLLAYANELMKITEQFGGYPPPGNTWYAGNSKSDLYQYANENVRSKFLETWQANADAMFNPQNMTKIEAAYGKDFAKNLKEVLRRMKTGSNRPVGGSESANQMMNYINGSVGTIMFLNMRSAVLQTISAVNFLNWHDNNLFKAGATLGNPKNFVKNFMEIMNSDFLKQRRNGLEINVNEAEIAQAAAQSKNKARAVFNYIIKAGYKPTQFADSFAIAVGGTPMLINRTKTYEKQGMTYEEARAKAFTDFRAIAEENQQSSRTDRTSNIQAGHLGRFVFAFNNTPFQMTRLFKKATLDLINGRGDFKTNVSKMLYYGAIQNIIFYSLQQMYMAFLFGADEEEEKNKKKRDKKMSDRTTRIANSTIDGILRGSGLPGAIISTIKNTILEYQKQEARGDFMAEHGKTLVAALNFSPPLGSKAARVLSALNAKKFEKTNFDYLKNKAKIISALTNVPVDRLMTKMDNLYVATTQPIDTWKRIFLINGWDQWSLDVYDDLKDINAANEPEEPEVDRSAIMKEVWRKRKAEDKRVRDSIINTFRK
jgi:hypothetical protein